MSGCEWLIEAHGCDAAGLADLNSLRGLFAGLVAGLDLHPVSDATWHQFPGTGGITGLCLLAESHLACHTFPEYQSLCLNVFCCRERPDWAFAEQLHLLFGAQRVDVRKLERPYQ